MGLTSEYFETQAKYQQKYGPNTVVLMQVGSFYEIYEFDPTRSDQVVSDDRLSIIESRENDHGDDNSTTSTVYTESIGKAVEMSFTLNMLLTSKAKARPHTVDNPFMVGFPCLAYEKHRDLIIANDYTIIRIDQIPNSGDPPERKVAEVASAATEIDSVMLSTTGTNQVVSIYIECQKVDQRLEEYALIGGMSSIDVATGENIVCEVYSKDQNNVHALQEIYRFLASQQPREVIVNLSGIPPDKIDTYTSHIYETLELHNYPTLIFNIDEIDSNYLNIQYQTEFLQKVFHPPKESTSSSGIKMMIRQPSNSGVIGVIEEIDLDRLHYGRISYLALLQYCYEHNETIVRKIRKPRLAWTDETRHLILTHNAIHQLDLLPPVNHRGASAGVGIGSRGRVKKIDSLLSVVDNTSTTLGKRMLRNMLLNPIVDSDELNRMYGIVEELLGHPDLLKRIEMLMKQIPDIERLHRKIVMKVMKPNEFSTLFRSYIKIIDLCTTLLSANDAMPNLKTILMSSGDIEDFNSCLRHVYSCINFDKIDSAKMTDSLKRIDTDTSFFLPGVNPTIDQLETNIQTCRERIQEICDYLNTFLTSTRGKMIVPSFDRKKKSDNGEEIDMSISLSTTNHKASVLKQAISQIDKSICGDLEFTTTRSTTAITSPIIQQLCDCFEQSKSMMERVLFQAYQDLLGHITNTYTFFEPLTRFIAILDYIKSNARTASRFCYHRPEIVSDALTSFVEMSDARHPIIERIISSEYVPNDLSLGWPVSDTSDQDVNNPLGMLLFGINSAGKSSVGKMSALIVIMAQAGMYTPARLRYKPYSKIITRLSGNDDIFKGHSSFVVEMSELRTILRQADSSTLVIGDELCRGTESISGTSLTVATVQSLVDAKASFIFSTHMHHLPEIPQINALSKSQLRICHLTAVYDDTLKTLVYERKLAEGPGSSIYGLEVCRSLAIESEFIEKANSVRRELAGIPPMLLATKKSRYNALVRVDMCSMCGVTIDLHTHHVKEQHTADDNGYIDHFHKNREFNMLVLCQKCHTNLHASNIQLQPKQTLNGVYFEMIE